MIEIYDLAFEEKIALMEELWEDLSKKHQEDIIPDWHKKVLKDRENSTDFDSLKSVKARLEKYLNG